MVLKNDHFSCEGSNERFVFKKDSLFLKSKRSFWFKKKSKNETKTLTTLHVNRPQ